MTTMPVPDLVSAAASGDDEAWAQLIERYSPLVVTVINRFGLNRADAADVNQTLWLRLVEHLDKLREPAALPGWIVQTTRHECLRLVRAEKRTWLFDPMDAAAETYVEAANPLDPDTLDAGLLRAERHQALRDAYRQLAPRCQQLVTMLLHEPPPSYEEIGQRLGIPVGSVGPTRGRCVHKLRSCPALAAFTDAVGEAGTEREASRDAATVGR